MPVKSELDCLLDPDDAMDYFADFFAPARDMENRVSDPLLPEGIWDKFQFEFPELRCRLEDWYNCGAWTDCKGQVFPNIILEDDHINHDCMWAGHCSSREHSVDEPKGASIPPLIPKPPQIFKPQVAVNPQSVLKPTVRAAAVVAPQTPPESDDEEKQTPVLEILNQAISECDFEDDSDLCEYFEDADDAIEVKEEPVEVKEEEPEVKEEPAERSDESEEEHRKFVSFTALAAENDHSYYKDKNASRMINFGLDTPSDSEEEEEIDVVSVTDKFLTAYQRMMPTNPSSRDCKHIQRSFATAMTKRRSATTTTATPGIKTIMPVRKSAAAATETAKRGQKRGRGHRATGATPRKRQHYAGSDSEPEPSEKRSLHNNMERQRRIDLRNAFEELRVLVPEVAKKDRAAKVVILREAAGYCDRLGATARAHDRQKEELKRRQEWLRHRVSQLRRSLAANR